MFGLDFVADNNRTPDPTSWHKVAKLKILKNETGQTILG